MLGKLIKHEFRATRRTMLPLLMVFAIGSALAIVGFYLNAIRIEKNPVTITEEWGVLFIIFFSMTMMFYGIMIATAVCMNIFVSASRFEKNLLGDEGYLMHTLPVTAGQKLASKLIMSIIWAAVSLAIMVLSATAISDIVNNAGLFSITAFSSSSIFGDYGILHMLLSYAETFFGFCRFYLVLFAAMAIGYSVNDHRRIFSVAAGSGIFIGINIIDSIIQAIYNWKRVGFSVVGIMFYADNTGWVLDLIQLAACIVTCVVLFFVTRYFLDKKLNLQ